MYAFQNQHTSLTQPLLLAVVLPHTCSEVVAWNLNFLSCKEFQKILLKGLVVHSVEIIKIVLSVREQRSVHSVHKVVICRESQRLKSASLELHAEPLGEGGLSRTGRSCNQHQTHFGFRIVAGLYFLGNLDYFLFLKSLGNLNQFAAVALAELMVDISGIVELGDDIPAQILGKHVESLGLGDIRHKTARIIVVRNPEQYSVVVSLNVPDLEIGSGWKQSSVVVVRAVSEQIIVGIDILAGFQQTDLVDIAEVSENLDCLAYLDFPSVEGYVFLNHLKHTLLDFEHIFIAEGTVILFLEIAIETS